MFLKDSRDQPSPPPPPPPSDTTTVVVVGGGSRGRGRSRPGGLRTPQSGPALIGWFGFVGCLVLRWDLWIWGDHRGAHPRLCRRLDSGRETVPAHTCGHTNGQGASNPGAPCSPFSPLGPFLPFFPFSPCGYNHWVKLATFSTFRTAPGLAGVGGGEAFKEECWG